jgi:hypothetical protein
MNDLLSAILTRFEKLEARVDACQCVQHASTRGELNRIVARQPPGSGCVWNYDGSVYCAPMEK